MKMIFALVLLIVIVPLLVAMVVALVSIMAIALAIGIPTYLLARHFSQKNSRIVQFAHNPMERLQQLYIEGKIDLFEFERRVARLIAVEHY